MKWHDPEILSQSFFYDLLAEVDPDETVHMICCTQTLYMKLEKSIILLMLIEYSESGLTSSLSQRQFSIKLLSLLKGLAEIVLKEELNRH